MIQPKARAWGAAPRSLVSRESVVTFGILASRSFSKATACFGSTETSSWASSSTPGNLRRRRFGDPLLPQYSDAGGDQHGPKK